MKLCKNCKHYVKADDGMYFTGVNTEHSCFRDKTIEQHPVTGSKHYSRVKSATQERDGWGIFTCGKNAKYFEEKNNE